MSYVSWDTLLMNKWTAFDFGCFNTIDKVSDLIIYCPDTKPYLLMCEYRPHGELFYYCNSKKDWVIFNEREKIKYFYSFTHVIEVNLQKFPIPTDFKKDEIMIIFDKDRKEFSFHRFDKIDGYSYNFIFVFNKIGDNQTSIWSNKSASSHLQWYRPNGRWTDLLEDIPDPIEDRFHILDL